jgi:hypothetical protein
MVASFIHSNPIQQALLFPHTYKIMSAVPVVASTPKTLPMKLKAMHYALVHFVSTEASFTDEQRSLLMAKLPIHGGVEKQVSFYEAIDWKAVENDILKPLNQQRKLEEKEAVKAAKAAEKAATKSESKPTKVRVRKEKKVEEPKTEEPKVAEPKVAEPKAEPIETPSTPVLNPTTKVRTTKKKVEPSKPVQEEPLTEEMKEEPYVEEKPKKKTVPRKKKTPPPPPPSTEELESYLWIHEGTRYWITDEHELNGDVYDDGKDADGDSAPGKKIGCLMNGKLVKTVEL